MRTYYHTLSESVLGVYEHHLIKKALTHKSFYENKEEYKEGNSKYIFLGMYAFKGKVAEILRTYMPLTGTQLQHYLGNIFKNKQLENIYKRYHLKKCVRHSSDFPIKKQHHIFVYALLGFVFQYANEKKLTQFIYRNFLENTEHLLPNKKTFSKDQWSQCLYLVKMHYNAVPTMSFLKEEDNNYTCTLFVEKESIAQGTSSSKQYAQKKCLKIALQYIAEAIKKEWISNPINIESEKRIKKLESERIAKQRHQKIKEYKERQKTRAFRVAKRKAKRKKEMILRDLERRKAKAKAKKRREEREQKLKEMKMALSTMSVAKRRHLQDKGLLEKGAPPPTE